MSAKAWNSRVAKGIRNLLNKEQGVRPASYMQILRVVDSQPRLMNETRQDMAARVLRECRDQLVER